MKQFLVYLAGPITGLTYDGAVEWRENIKDQLAGTNISTLSPMRAKEFLRNKQDVGEKIWDSYEETALASVKGINTRDYNDVRRSDAVFVNFLGAEKVSIGTVMEIAWCRAFSIPVVCVMEKDNIHNHSMLNYACGYIVETLEEGLDVLKALIGPDEVLKPAKLWD